jgi:hypothetical protein
VSNYRLHGNIEVGGDVIVYNSSGNCDNGVYYRMTNYYDDKLLECDGRTADHPDNLDVNQAILSFSTEQMLPFCHCGNYPDCFLVSDGKVEKENPGLYFFPVPVTQYLQLAGEIKGKKQIRLDLYDLLGQPVLSSVADQTEDFRLDVSGLNEAVYIGVISMDGHQILRQKVVIFREH